MVRLLITLQLTLFYLYHQQVFRLFQFFSIMIGSQCFHCQHLIGSQPFFPSMNWASSQHHLGSLRMNFPSGYNAIKLNFPIFLTFTFVPSLQTAPTTFSHLGFDLLNSLMQVISQSYLPFQHSYYPIENVEAMSLELHLSTFIIESVGDWCDPLQVLHLRRRVWMNDVWT